MNAKKLTEAYAAASQIVAADVAGIASAGYRSIMCNRPDKETPGQPDFDEIAKVAQAAGLVVRHVPVVSGMITQADVDSFNLAIRELPTPVFAYCRSGARCSTLWSLSEASQKG
jgi:sulfide:quinone oxidoreductase